MSAAILTDLALRLRANTAELQQGLERAKANIKTFKKDTKDATGELKSAFQDLGGQASAGLSRMGSGFSAMISAMGGALKSVKGLTAGMSGLKTALISTGIGAIFVAIGTAIAGVTAYLKGSVDGANKLASVMGWLKGVFTAVKDVFISVGRFLVKMFEDPKTAISDLWEFIKKNLVNRFNGMVEFFQKGWQVIANGAKGVGMAVAGIFNKDKREEAAQYFNQMKTDLIDMGKAAFKMATGLDFDETAEKASQKFQEIKKEVKEIQAINERSHSLDMKKIDFLTQEAIMNRDIKVQRELASDKLLDFNSRLEAGNKALKIASDLYAARIAYATETLNIKKAENAASETSVDDLREEKQLAADLINLEGERADVIKSIKNEMEEIRAAQKANDEKIAAEKAALEEAERTKREEEEKRIQDSILAYREKRLSETLEGELIVLADRLKRGEIQYEEYAGEVNRIQDEIHKKFLADQDEQIKKAREARDAKIESVNSYMDAALQATEVVSMMFEAAKNRELAAAGDNEAKKEEIEKKYAKKQKSLAIIQAIINTALGITKAIGQGGILGFITGALVAAAGAAQIAVIASQPLAKGGIAYSPVNALVGEYPSASRNPEVIAPLDKLRGILGTDKKGGEQKVKFVIDGYQLVGILDKQLKLNGAF